MKLDAWESWGVMPLPRAGCAVAAQPDGIVVAGGTYWEAGRKIWSTRADQFRPDSGTWEIRPALPHAIGDAAGVNFHGRTFVAGGGTADEIFREIWELDGARWVRAGALPSGRRSFVTVVHGDELIALGGMTAGPTDYGAATSVVWRGQGSAWSEAAPMPGPARLGFAAGICAGKLLIAGGFAAATGGGVVNLDEILAYDPSADRWSSLGRLPSAVRGVGGLVWDARGLLVLGGYTDAFSRRIWLVEADGAVTDAGELPVGLADGRFAWWGGRVIALTGEDGIKLRYAACVRTARSVEQAQA